MVGWRRRAETGVKPTGIRVHTIWSEKDVRSRVGKFSVWGMKSPSSLGRVFVVFENRPIILGENNRAQASIKKFPVDEAVLPEAGQSVAIEIAKENVTHGP